MGCEFFLGFQSVPSLHQMPFLSSLSLSHPHVHPLTSAASSDGTRSNHTVTRGAHCFNLSRYVTDLMHDVIHALMCDVKMKCAAALWRQLSKKKGKKIAQWESRGWIKAWNSFSSSPETKYVAVFVKNWRCKSRTDLWGIVIKMFPEQQQLTKPQHRK